MTTELINLDAVLARHLQLAVRLHNAGHSHLALEVTLSALAHEPPSAESRLLQFLVRALLAEAGGGETPAGEQVRRRLEADAALGRAAAELARFYLDETADAGEGGDEPIDAAARQALSSLVDSLAAEPLGGPGEPAADAKALPPGCARGVVVERDGTGRMTRVHVRFGNWSDLDGQLVVGQVVPGARAAIEAAAQYLDKAGCEPIAGLQAEVLVEGLFRPITGESLALAVFAGAVSARLGMALPASWAFTGGVGSTSADSAASEVMPVDEIRAKLAACGQAGCERLMVPAHLLPAAAADGVGGACRVETAATTAGAIERVLPAHRLPDPPAEAGWGEFLGQFVRSMVPGGRAGEPGRALPHGAYRAAAAGLFAAMVTERWLFGDYLVAEYYEGVWRAGPVLAAAVGCLAAALVAAVTYASLRVIDRLMDRGRIAAWWRAAAALLLGHVAVWLVAQVLIRNPLAPPPRKLYWEHRTLQWWKDTTALFLYALLFYVGPYVRVRLAERAASAGRLRWAREVLAGRRWAEATLPVATLPMLIVIAAIALMGLGYLDWQSLIDPARAGAGSMNGPWRTIHIIGRAYLYVASCAAAFWWMAKAGRRAVRGG